MFRIDQALYEIFAIQFYKVVCIKFGMWLIAIIIKNTSLIDVAWTSFNFMVGFLNKEFFKFLKNIESLSHHWTSNARHLVIKAV